MEGNQNQTPVATCTFLKDAVEQTSQVFISNIITIALDFLVAVSATASNAFIAYVIWKTKVLHSPSNTLLCCLAVTDFLTGLVVAPLNIATKMGEMQSNNGVYCGAGVASSLATWIVASVSFLTLSLISVERYLAVKLHLRYNTLITSNRMLKIVAVFWVYMTTLCMLRFWDTKETYVRPFVIANIVLNLTVTVVCYHKIYSIVRHHRKKIKLESSVQETSLQESEDEVCTKTEAVYINKREMARYRRSTLTMVYIVVCFFICYSPTLLYQVVIGLNKNFDERSTRIAYRCCVTVAMLKSSLNPLLYCLRLKEIRVPLKKTLKEWYERIAKYISSSSADKQTTVVNNKKKSNSMNFGKEQV